MSSDPPPRRSRSGISSRPRTSSRTSVASPLLLGPQHLLHRLGHPLVGVAPLWQADLDDVGVHRLGERLVHVLRPGGAEHPRVDGRAGHQRGALRHLVADFPHPHDARVVGLAEEVPDRRGRRDHIRLVAAVGDDVMRALLDPEVLAAVVPPNVHQLDRVERAAPVPGRTGAVGALTFEQIFDRDQPVAPALPPADVHAVADVGIEHDVDVVEQTGADVVRLGAKLLLGDARPDLEGARQPFTLHDLLDREHGGHVERLPRVVSLAVPGRPLINGSR